jgi:hypothetical protein
MAETPRNSPPLEVWTAPLVGSLKSADARTLQHIFTSLKEHLKDVQTTISSNYYNLAIGSVSAGTTPSASITGSFPNQLLNLVLAQGPTGATGPQGPVGATGSSGYSTLNLDGGAPNSVYGGVNPINAGGV